MPLDGGGGSVGPGVGPGPGVASGFADPSAGHPPRPLLSGPLPGALPSVPYIPANDGSSSIVTSMQFQNCSGTDVVSGSGHGVGARAEYHHALFGNV